MSSKNLHPSVKQFKDFVTKHPKLVKEVREKGESWQSYYEKWVLLGDEDSFWDKFKEQKEKKNEKKSSAKEETIKSAEEKENKEENQKEFMSQLMDMIEKVDLNKVQGHISHLDGAIQNIQTLVGQFQEMKKQMPSKSAQASRPKSPFHFGKD